MKNLEVRITGDIDKCWEASRHSTDDWGGPAVADVGLRPCTLTDCMLFLKSSLASSDAEHLNEIYEKLDEHVDGSDGPGAGKIRARDKFGAYTLFYELMPEYITLNR